MLRLRTIAWLMSLSWLAMLPASLAAKPAPAPANLIKVYKYQGSLQCQGGANLWLRCADN